MPTVLPVALTLQGRPCLVVGGGRVAARKAVDLLGADATVRLVAPTVDPGIAAAADRDPRITVRIGTYRPEDLDGVWLAVAATGDRDVNQRVFDDAERRGTLVNSVDDPDRCTFHFNALVRRDPVVVSVSTSGTAPALASYLRARLEAVLEPSLGTLAELLGELRAELHAAGASTEAVDWSSIVTDELVELVGRGGPDEVRARLRDRPDTRRGAA
jgi:siroheme synthase-like protein